MQDNVNRRLQKLLIVYLDVRETKHRTDKTVKEYRTANRDSTAVIPARQYTGSIEGRAKRIPWKKKPPPAQGYGC